MTPFAGELSHESTRRRRRIESSPSCWQPAAVGVAQPVDGPVRASYSGECSIGSPDAGAVAIAIIIERITGGWDQR